MKNALPYYPAATTDMQQIIASTRQLCNVVCRMSSGPSVRLLAPGALIIIIIIIIIIIPQLFETLFREAV